MKLAFFPYFLPVMECIKIKFENNASKIFCAFTTVEHQ